MKIAIRYCIILFITGLFVTGCTKLPVNGVSFQLAVERKKLLSNIEYSLHFSIPKKKSLKIDGKIEITFKAERRNDVVLDFRENESNIKSVKINSENAKYQFHKGHLIVPEKYIRRGENKITIAFITGEGSLNRKDDFLYTLFVPDRASTAFPCFDQPDLKSVYNLTLDLPEKWKAVSNGAVILVTGNDSIKTLSFGPTKPISTYLFAFAAGRFDTIGRHENQRNITIYHRENDSLKVKRNLDAIFTSHFHSLNWLFNYTGIDYPFSKLDIILIPDFQYSGMEHPGAIYYRDSQLLLNENPSVNQKLGQASLIAHEVSHQWFGDLVTMRWFNDIWLKEVFAGFMADKIVNPQFPDIDHDLNFLLSHYPRAYAVDRTEGANPIRQPLDNLLFAGTLYGDIIYHKAPVMMMQLELLMGKESFKEGIRQYLQKYSMNNAGWEDLVSILDPLTPYDLSSWSKSWVDIPGMPVIESVADLTREGRIGKYTLIQSKKDPELPAMGMKFRLSAYAPDNRTDYEVEMSEDTITIAGLRNRTLNTLILPNSDGKGYGTFYPDTCTLRMLLNDSTVLSDNLSRASWFVMLNELFLNGRIDTRKYFVSLVSKISQESEPQIRQYLLNNSETVWWRFFRTAERKEYSKFFEDNLYRLLSSGKIEEKERKPLFWTYVRIATNDEALEQLYKIWCNKIRLDGIKPDESDYMVIACELAVRDYNNTDSILKVQETRVTNSDRLAKFRFMKRAVSSDSAARDSFFKSLYDPVNRRPEPWVTESLHYFHHPLRSEYSVKYLRNALDLLPEIQQTGDIFFPKSWLDATLQGYSSPEAYRIVMEWLQENQGLPENLRNKVIQSADILKRAAHMQ
jgi:aminopeptidase N